MDNVSSSDKTVDLPGPPSRGRAIVQVAIVTVLLTVAAAGSRYAGLGKWSFFPPELSTVVEARSLCERPLGDVKKFDDMLARVSPLSYLLIYQAVKRELPKPSEFSARLVPAICNVISVPLLYLLAVGIVGQGPALGVGLLLLFWPFHIFQGQNCRFYSQAFLFASLAAFTYLLALKRQSRALAVIAALAGLLGVMTQFFAILTPLALGAVTLFSLFRSKWWSAFFHPRTAWWYLIVSAAMVGAFGLYLLWIFIYHRQPNPYTPYAFRQVIPALIYNTGLGMGFAGLIGIVTVIRSGSSSARAGLIILVILTVVIGAFIPFWHVHPASVYINMGSFILLAGIGLARVYSALTERHRILAVAVSAFILAWWLPQFATHYISGNRHDFRNAGTWIQEQWRQGDRILAWSPLYVKHYMKNKDLSCRESREKNLQQAFSALQPGHRLWIVHHVERGGLPEDQWALYQRYASLVKIVEPRSFIYHANRILIFRGEKPSPPPAGANKDKS